VSFDRVEAYEQKRTQPGSVTHYLVGTTVSLGHGSEASNTSIEWAMEQTLYIIRFQLPSP
jgi:hypothetical protein